MAIKHIKVNITIKWWAKPVIFAFVLLGMYPPKWAFSMSKPYYEDEI